MNNNRKFAQSASDYTPRSDGLINNHNQTQHQPGEPMQTCSNAACLSVR